MYNLADADFDFEHYDVYELAMIEEMRTYELIHALLADIRRLARLVMDTREEVNNLSPGGIVYYMTAEDVFDGTYYDHPAMKRYFEIYGHCGDVFAE